jgi:subfamily B ATP-binding cassette protein MsbA
MSSPKASKARRKAHSKAPSAAARRNDTWPLLHRLVSTYIRPHRVDLSWAVLAMLVLAFALTMQAYLIGPFFNKGLIGKHIGVVNTVVVVMVTLTIARGIASYFQDYLMESVGQRIVARLQDEMYARTIRQDLGFFAKYPTGALTSRFVSDLQRLKYAVTQTFASGLRDFGTIIGLFANMFIQDWRLTILTLVIVPLSIFPIRRFGRLSRKYSRVNQESTGRLAHSLNQTLGHIRQVQSFAMEAREMERVSARTMDVLGSTLKAVSVRALSSPTVEFIITLALGCLMYYAGQLVNDGHLTPGAFASFVASVIMVVRPLKSMTNMNNNLQEGLAAAQRAFELIDAPLALTDAKGAKPLKVKKAAITLTDAVLTYQDGTTALEGVSLDIPSGRTVALVGPSGAGKTSILNLIPRFYDLTSGRLAIDGQDVGKVTLASLRRSIALVTQDVAIFDDTIAANIAYGNPGASQKEIEAAARAAAAEEFIVKLPEGYATILGENGMKLSGGQKQRLALARALLKNAPILLLDEATSALDTASEKLVQKAIENSSKNRTTVIVAHRLSTITHADTIHVLKHGRVVESGSHAQLLKKKGLYAKLWAMQARGSGLE